MVSVVAQPTWTPERVAKLQEMKDQPRLEILAVLKTMPGGPLTRNSINGKCDRLFAVRKPQRTPEEKEAARAASRAKDAAQKRANRLSLRVGAQVQAINRGPKIKPEKFKGRVADVVSLRKPLLDLEAMECRWADEHRNADNVHTFCGNPTLDGQSYCECHRQLNRGVGTSSERSAGRMARAA